MSDLECSGLGLTQITGTLQSLQMEPTATVQMDNGSADATGKWIYTPNTNFNGADTFHGNDH